MPGPESSCQFPDKSTNREAKNRRDPFIYLHSRAYLIKDPEYIMHTEYPYYETLAAIRGYAEAQTYVFLRWSNSITHVAECQAERSD